MVERFTQSLRNINTSVRSFAKRHETALFTADTVGLGLVIFPLVNIMAIEKLAPLYRPDLFELLVIGEFVSLKILSAVSATAIYLRARPSEVIRELSLREDSITSRT